MPRLMAAALLLAFGAFAPSLSRAASLDLSASYGAKLQSYSNLNLDKNSENKHSFLSSDGRLGFAARQIYLDTWRGQEMAMDVVLGLHALGIAGSTTSLQSPFDRAAARYPSTSFIPFLEKAYLNVHNFLGLPVDVALGRRNFRLASGLLLDDDGAGLTGTTAGWSAPWAGIKAEAFYFFAKNAQVGPDNLNLYGLTITIPTEGTWQLSQLIEDDRKRQTQYACAHSNNPIEGCQAYRTKRLFSSARYQLHYGPIMFEGEAALQLGKAKIDTSMTPNAPKQVTFFGNAQVLRAKWKQRLYRTGEGIARITVARGSGDDPGTTDIDEAFFPSLGHQYDGLERSGFGEFFGATPYDAFGGNYSSTTASGLKPGASGIVSVGAGYTFPSYKGVALDVDYWLFQADRIRRGKRTLGGEWDFTLRYNVRDIFSMSLTAALFGVGTASDTTLGRAKKYSFEVFGRF